METNIEEIEINKIKYVMKDSTRHVEIPKGDESNPFFVVGLSYFIRTVTHYFTGRLIWVGEKEICLEDACWIANTGRFHKFIDGKEVDESEPFPRGARVIIGRGSIIDMTEHGLILDVK